MLLLWLLVPSKLFIGALRETASKAYSLRGPTTTIYGWRGA